MSGISFRPSSTKYRVPRTQTPMPKGVMLKKPKGLRPFWAMTSLAVALEPTPTRVTKPPNWAPKSRASKLREGPNPAAIHMAVTRGAMAVMTPMLLQTELSRQETIRVTRMMFRSFLPVILTIFSPIRSVIPEWKREAPTTIMPHSRTMVVLL